MEYKRLSEVDMGTADNSTNVLVEVGGEIKRVPKNEVGGGGAGGYIMTLTKDNCTKENGDYTCTENYNKIYDVLMAGGNVWFHDETTSEKLKYMCMAWQKTNDALVIATIMPAIVFPNGSHNPSIQ